MTAEIKACQNCKQSFTLAPEDFSFYHRIQVPPPTWCPECRFQRRLLFLNPIHLFKRACDLCGEIKVSVYPPEAPYRVYCSPCWWSDNWSPLAYGRDYDFSRPFFEQLKELWREVPLLGLSIDLATVRSSPYNHDAGRLKNCYLLFHALECEDSAYGYYLGHSQMMMDSTAVEQCQYGYDSMHSYRTNRCIGSRHQLAESADCLFCRDCQNCQNCFASANLKNKKYHAWNKPLTKEEYEAETAKYDLGSHRAYEEVQQKAEEFWGTQILKSEYNEFATNCSGPNVFHSKNAKDCMEVYDAEDSRYLFRMWGPVRNCYDVSMWGDNLSDSYDSGVVGEGSVRMLFSHESGLGQSGAEYSKLSVGGSRHFGCVSVRKKECCIFNKPYAKADYEKLAARIREHMNEMPFVDRQGNAYRYGEFFPPEMSPFAYNLTLAQNFFPLGKIQAEEKGYAWREPEQKEFELTKRTEDLPDHIRDVSEEILKEVIRCRACGRGYQIVPLELEFHRRMKVALPRECPFCRISRKLDLWVKNLKRIKRTCAGCGKAMESKYLEAEGPVYCRGCYLDRI